MVKKAKPLYNETYANIWPLFKILRNCCKKMKKTKEKEKLISLPSNLDIDHGEKLDLVKKHTFGKMPTLDWQKTFEMAHKKTPAELSGFQSIGEERRIINVKDLKDNHYLRFGLGVNGYFNILEILIKIFVFLSFFATIQIIILRSQDAHSTQSYQTTFLGEIDWTLGSFAFSKP